jgi:hypothetical protein
VCTAHLATYCGCGYNTNKLPTPAQTTFFCCRSWVAKFSSSTWTPAIWGPFRSFGHRLHLKARKRLIRRYCLDDGRHRSRHILLYTGTKSKSPKHSKNEYKDLFEAMAIRSLCWPAYIEDPTICVSEHQLSFEACQPMKS